MILLPLALLLCACHNKEAPPAPTAEQSDQLNDTENMLNALTANENGPEANAPGPSK